MTTNRMGLEKALSDERLKLFIRQPLDNGLTRGEQMELVREALARRKASKEVYGYVNKAVFEMTGSVGLSNDHEHCADSPSYIPLYAAPPLQAVTVPDEICIRQAMVKMEAHDFCTSVNSGYKNGWNDCIAAMLKQNDQ